MEGIFIVQYVDWIYVPRKWSQLAKLQARKQSVEGPEIGDFEI